MNSRVENPKRFALIVVSLILFSVTLSSVHCYIKFEDDITLTLDQAKSLKEFKDRMLPQLSVDYMKDDIYLVKWLKARRFDVVKAENFLQKHLDWRKETNFDNLQFDEFVDIEKDYPMEVVGEDREGRPLIQLPLDEWDIRKASVAGKLDRLVLYASFMINNAWLKVREAQQQGKNVTRSMALVTVGKVNVAQHLTVACLPFYVNMALLYEKNFPRMVDDIWILNSPLIFQVAINLVKAVFDEETRNLLQVFSANRKEWMEMVDKRIDNSQLITTFGGTMISKHGI